jgi:hypothetical protein
MLMQIDKKERAVVVLGKFNPAIFHPSWFKANDLMRESEIEGADLKVVTNDLTIFKCGWLTVNVEQQRLQYLTTFESAFKSLMDISSSTFKILHHTPVQTFGINHTQYYSFGTQEERDAFGYKLVPKSNWDSFSSYVGFNNLEVYLNRKDAFAGRFGVTVAPEPGSRTVVRISFNDHHQFDQTKLSATRLSELILEEWNKSEQYAEEVFKGLENHMRRA